MVLNVAAISEPTPVQRRALLAARTAPSAHNAQPWRFRVHADALELVWAADRELPHGDPHRTYLMAGLGAAAEGAALGVALEGHAARVVWDLNEAERRVARIQTVTRPAAAGRVTLASALDDRATTRTPFRTDQIPAPVLRALVREAEEARCSLSVAAGSSQLSRFADLVVEGTARNMADPLIYREFSGWLRLGWRERTAVDGLTASALSFGRVRRALSVPVMSPTAMRAWRAMGVHRLLASSQRRLARNAGAVCLLAARSNERHALFEGGRVMLRLWLAATLAGFRVHPMTAALDHLETRGPLADLFGMPAEGALVVCFRMGLGPAGPRAPRLPLERLIEPTVAMRSIR